MQYATIPFGKTPTWAGKMSDTTIEIRSSKTISLKTRGHEKCRVTIKLASKCDGTKMKPFTVFKGAKREDEKGLPE